VSRLSSDSRIRRTKRLSKQLVLSKQWDRALRLALRVPLELVLVDDGGNGRVLGQVLLGLLKRANIGTCHTLQVMTLQSC
jgi:hypothetical protein